jgi:hypothetical protein
MSSFQRKQKFRKNGVQSIKKLPEEVMTCKGATMVYALCFINGPIFPSSPLFEYYAFKYSKIQRHIQPYLKKAARP